VSAIQQNLTKLEKVTKSLPKGSQRSPISAKIAQKNAPTYHLKTRETKTPKRHSNKTCLSKGTGSAFQEGEFAKHSLNNCMNLNQRWREQKEREREKDRERDRERKPNITKNMQKHSQRASKRTN